MMDDAERADYELDEGTGVAMPAPPCSWCNRADFTTVVYGLRLCVDCGTVFLRALRETRAGEAARVIVDQEQAAAQADW